MNLKKVIFKADESGKYTGKEMTAFCQSELDNFTVYVEYSPRENG